MARPSSRWLVPVGAAGLVAAGVLVAQVTASADLPPRTPEEVLVLAQQADVQGFSGVLETGTELGLPDLDALGLGSGEGGGPGRDDEAPSVDVLALLTGDNTVRMWADGPELFRAQLLEDVSETNVVRNGDDLWVYRSADASAVHAMVPEPPKGEPDSPSAGPVPTPQELADHVLAALEPTSQIAAGRPVVVAGRPAYDLRVSPDDPRSLVDTVSLAVDAETGAALRVAVTARGQDAPAVEVGWVSWTPEPPDAGIFDFSPPPGTTVEEVSPGPEHGGPDATSRTGGVSPEPEGPRPVVLGEGWTAVLEVPAGAAPSGDEEMLRALLTPVEDGAVLSTALVSALRTDDGRWYVGAVTPEALVAVARGR